METNEISLSGRKYISDFKSNDLPTILYLHGSGSNDKTLDHIRGCAFYKLFYTAFKSNFNFFFPLQEGGFSGWENKIGGVSSGAYFAKEIIALHGIKNIVPTGHSSGATYATVTTLPGVFKGFIPVAGRSLDYKGTKAMFPNGTMLNAWHGLDDHGSFNNIDDGKQAVEWYKMGGGTPIFHMLEGVGHGSDSIAYKPTSGIKEWIEGLFPKAEPVKSGLYVDNIWIGDTEGTFEGHTIEYRN